MTDDTKPTHSGRKPGTILFNAPDECAISYPHVDPREGYVFARKPDGSSAFFPWHRITAITRDNGSEDDR